MSSRAKKPSVCRTCGKEFYPRVDLLSVGRGLFCSQKCGTGSEKSKNRQKTAKPPKPPALQGEANPAWKGGVTKWYGANAKVKARVMARQAKRRGKLVPSPCEICKATASIEMHHEDYSKPLDVRWLCKTCHDAIH